MEPGGTAGPRRVGTGGARRERSTTNTPRLRKSNCRFRGKGRGRKRDHDESLATGEVGMDPAPPNS
ncbi:unnamed protein product [Ectocarpus fasciculatus]